MRVTYYKINLFPHLINSQCSFQLRKNPDNPDALQQVWNWNVLLNGRNVKLLYALFSLFGYILLIYLFVFSFS